MKKFLFLILAISSLAVVSHAQTGEDYKTAAAIQGSSLESPNAREIIIKSGTIIEATRNLADTAFREGTRLGQTIIPTRIDYNSKMHCAKGIYFITLDSGRAELTGFNCIEQK